MAKVTLSERKTKFICIFPNDSTFDVVKGTNLIHNLQLIIIIICVFRILCVLLRFENSKNEL